MATNAEWMIKQGYKFNDIDSYFKKKEKSYHIFIKNMYMDKVTVGEGDTETGTILKWLDMEHNALDNSERCYLYNIIRPFRSEIKNIEKRRNADNSLDRIIFNMKDHEMFFLPLFKAETMYKGMTPNKEYTLEELGL